MHCTCDIFYCRTPTYKPVKRRKIEPDAIELEILRQLKATAQPEAVPNMHTMASDDGVFLWESNSLNFEKATTTKESSGKNKNSTITIR